MPDSLIYLLLSILGAGVAALLAGSACLWWKILNAWRLGERVWFPVEWSESELIPADTQAKLPASTASGPAGAGELSRQLRLPAIFALLWIGLNLQFQLHIASLPAPVDPPPELPIEIDLTGAVTESFLVTGIALLLLAVSCSSLQSLREFGLVIRKPGGELLTGVLGFVASLAPVLVTIGLTAFMRGDEQLHPFLKLLGEQPSVRDLSLIFLTAAVLAPIKEELLFRVILQPFLQGFMPPSMAIGIVAGLFAAVHGLPDAIAIVPLALVLGYVFHRTRSYFAVVTLHALFNTYNLVLMSAYILARDLPGWE